MSWPDQFSKTNCQIKAWYYWIDLPNPLRSYNGLAHGQIWPLRKDCRMSLPIITYNTIRLCCWLRQYFKGQILKLTFENAVHELTFKVQLLKPVLWLLFLFFFSRGNRLQIFRAHHPQHDCVDEGRFVVPQYFHCYHAGIRFRCILHLQYGFRYLYIVVILGNPVCPCPCGYVYAIACGNEYESADVQNCYQFAHLQTCIAEKCVRCADAAQILAH